MRDWLGLEPHAQFVLDPAGRVDKKGRDDRRSRGHTMAWPAAGHSLFFRGLHFWGAVARRRSAKSRSATAR
jgi:hypothetical protein